MASSIKVAVRVRPFNQREIDMEAKLIVQMNGNKTSLLKPKLSSLRDSQRDGTNDFTFDHSYWSFDSNDSHFTTQDRVYEDLGTDVIKCAFQGYNACVFAYGQTGSGKTFTMMGSTESQGLIPRICKAMFARMKHDQQKIGTGYKTNVSYLEIYNERVRDLLGNTAANATHGLRVREHKTLGPYVEDLSQHSVSNYEEIQKCIHKGNTLRTTASTQMNDTSSRSHAIFTITFVKAGFIDDMPSETVSKIHLVDLAGSERCNATGATGQRLKEGGHINKSLVTLGSVISALAEQSQTPSTKRSIYIPYRDSTLTWLLKDSLGGNSKTIMIAAISPADCNYGETLSTLRYANRAKNILNKPTINEDPNVKLIRELREEIKKLKGMLGDGDDTEHLSDKMFEDLLKKEAQEKVLTEEWNEKWREAQNILRQQKALGLRMSGVGVVLDSEVPHLIGIHDDISTGVTLYSLKEGETHIGSNDSDRAQDIVLKGVGMQPEHCSIRLEDGIATIYPNINAQCWLNAYLINEPTRISQGDILLLGRTNMFRYNNPAEAARLRIGGNRSKLDLSRVSFIAASREDLCGSMFGDDDYINASTSRRTNPLQDSMMNIQDELKVENEHQKLIETIEAALERLNMERLYLHDQYRKRVQALSEELIQLEKAQCDQMAILKCREKNLIAKKEMLLWEKSNAKSQIDIVVRQMSALQTQLDIKKKDFNQYLDRIQLELLESGRFDKADFENGDLYQNLMKFTEDFDDATMECIRDTMKKSQNEIDTIETELISKENFLKNQSTELCEIDEKLLNVEDEEKQLITMRTENEIEAMKQKKKTLNLDVIPVVNPEYPLHVNGTNETTLETCDTFHTASSNCSSSDVAESICLDFLSPHDHNRNLSVGSPMTDSGVYIDTNKKENLLTSTPNNCISSREEQVTDENPSCSNSSCECDDDISELLNEPLASLNRLRKKIAISKAHIMKRLEINCDKKVLDEKIGELQHLQKQYFKLKLAVQQMRNGNGGILDGIIGHSDDDLDYSIGSSDELSSNIYSPVPTIYEPSLTRSNPGHCHDSEYFISIPSYLIRGAGKQTHYEYEIIVSLPNDKWTLLRRYNRFRELHLGLSSLYGKQVSQITFPRRKIFTLDSESVARNRRRRLETYLRCLLVVCSKIPQSPIYEGPNGPGLCKSTLIELSQFFQKGLFESGKHGTG